MKPARQPAQHPLLEGDNRLVAVPWIDFFDRLSRLQQAVAQLPTKGSYGSDAAAAAGGVGIGEVYRNGSFICVRVA